MRGVQAFEDTCHVVADIQCRKFKGNLAEASAEASASRSCSGGGGIFYFLFFNLAEPAASAASVQFTALGIWLCSPLILNEFHGPDVCHLSPRYFRPTGTIVCVCVWRGGGVPGLGETFLPTWRRNSSRGKLESSLM